DDEQRTVGSLAADERAGDLTRGGGEREPFGQRRVVDVGADGEGVRGRSSGGGQGAAGVGGQLDPSRAAGRLESQRTCVRGAAAAAGAAGAPGAAAAGA